MTTHIPVLLPAHGPPNPSQPHTIRQAQKAPPHPGWQRTNNYEDKYKPDAREEELNPNARVWKVYMDEAEIYDHDMLQGFRDTLDVNLVLAALFSAVIVTCAVQTTLDLDPDYAQITAHLMYEQLQLSRRAPGNLTDIPFSTFTPESATHSNLDVWINSLFYTSLSLSLASALLSGLARQWFSYYSSNVTHRAKTRSLHHQLRFNGLQKWKLKDIIALIPVILHLSLAIFLIGFALFVYRRHSFLSSIVFIITGFTFLFYTISGMLPAIWPECPYHNPVLSRATPRIIYLATMVWYYLLQLQYQALHFYNTLKLKLAAIWHRDISRPHSSFALRLLYSKSPDYPQLRVADRTIRQAIAINENILVADSLLWLVRETTNSSIQKIVIGSVATNISHLLPSYNSLFPLIAFACDTLFSPSLPDSEHPMLASFLCAVIKEFNYVVPWKDPHSDIPNYLVKEAIQNNQIDVVLAFLGSNNANIDSLDPSGYGRMLSLAVRYGQEDLTVLLLEKGASPNSHRHDFSGIPPLWLAILGSHIDVAKHLLEKGADPNHRHVKSKEHWGSVMYPLHMACLHGDITFLNLLLSNNANPHLPDDEGRNPLHVACAFRQVDAVKILMPLPEPFEVEGLEGDIVRSHTPLHSLCQRWAKSDDDFDMIADLLLTHDADMINARNDEGWTPLHIASHAGDIHAIQYLINCHADTSLTTTLHEHVLHLSCDRLWRPNLPTPESLELIEVLNFWCSQDENLNINIQDGKNKTPLLRVCESIWDENTHDHILAIADCLLSYGADIHAEDKDGWSPVKLSQRHEFDSLTKLLLKKGGGARAEGE